MCHGYRRWRFDWFGTVPADLGFEANHAAAVRTRRNSNLYSIFGELEQRVNLESLSVKVLPILGSVRNPHKLLDVMKTWHVDTVYHAAAYKHVPMVEHNIARRCVKQRYRHAQHCSGGPAVGSIELRSYFYRQGRTAD